MKRNSLLFLVAVLCCWALSREKANAKLQQIWNHFQQARQKRREKHQQQIDQAQMLQQQIESTTGILQNAQKQQHEAILAPLKAFSNAVSETKRTLTSQIEYMQFMRSESSEFKAVLASLRQLKSKIVQQMMPTE